MAPNSRVTIGLQFHLHGKFIAELGVLLLQRSNFSLSAQNFLHVMAQLVRDYVGLREFSRSAEAIFQLVEEGQVEINLFIARAVKRPGGSLGEATRGIDVVPEENHFCVAVLRKDLRPGILRIVENERNELHFFLFGGIARRVGWTGNGPRASIANSRATVQERRDQVALKDKTENEQNEQPANSDMNAAESTTARAAGIAIVFNVAAGAARSPSHVCTSYR